MVVPWLMYCSVLLAYGVGSVAFYVLGLLLMIVTYGVVTIHNDIEDYAVDVANNRADLPLVNGSIDVQSMRSLMMNLIIVGIIIAFFVGTNTLLWLGMYLFFGWLYSGPINLKGRGVWAVFVLGMCYGVMPWLLGYIVMSRMPSAYVWLLMAASFVFAAGSISMKDFKDVEGDRLHGKQTLLVKYGGDYIQRLILWSTSLAYCMVGIVLFASIGSVLSLIPIAVLAIINYVLLATPMIQISSVRRASSGSGAKLLFFVCVMVVNVIISG
jgi:chlorophyll synthase